MIVILSGDVHWGDYPTLCEKMDTLLIKAGNKEITIMNSGRPGAETIGLLYAKEKGYKDLCVLETANKVIESAKNSGDRIVGVIFGGNDDEVSNYYFQELTSNGAATRRISIS